MDNATNVIVHVDAPAGFTDWYQSLGVYDGHIWDIGTLEVNQNATLVVSGLLTPDMAGTNITNNANETQTEYPFQALALPATIYVKKTNVQFTNTVDKERPDVGDTVTFTIKVKNVDGPDIATNVVVNDLFSGCNPGTISKGNYTNGVWTIGTLGIGEEVIMTLTGIITADLAGKYTNNTAVETQTEYPQYILKEASIYVPIADLYIDTSLSKEKPVVGDIITIKFKLGNKGPDPAENVKITFVIPKGLKFISLVVDQGFVTYDPNTRRVTWTLDSVPVGDPYMWLTVKIMKAGTYTIGPLIFSTTYNVNTQVNPGYIQFKAYKYSSKTIGMQKTGIPINWLLLAILMVLSGLIIPKRRF